MNNILYILKKRIIRAATILLLLVIATVASIKSQGQQTKGPVQLADQYYAAGEYYTAANLYEQYLNPSKKQVEGTGFPLNSKRNQLSLPKGISRTDILYKQAESYRLSNHWAEASATYSKLLEKDSLKNMDAWYWKAVCERSLGNYDDAWHNLSKFVQSAPPGNTLAAAAQKE